MSPGDMVALQLLINNAGVSLHGDFAEISWMIFAG